MQLQLNLGHQKPKLGGQPNIISYIYCSIQVKSHKVSCHALQDIHSSLVEKEERKKILKPCSLCTTWCSRSTWVHRFFRVFRSLEEKRIHYHDDSAGFSSFCYMGFAWNQWFLSLISHSFRVLDEPCACCIIACRGLQ